MGEPAQSVPDRRPVVRFGPDRRLALLALGVALVFAVLALTTGDAAGRILYALAAALGLAIGAGGLLLTPWLVVGTAGLRVRRGLGRYAVSWPDLESADVTESMRHGMSSRVLEIDDGLSLTLLGRHLLGTDPREAAAVIAAFRP